MAQRVLVYVKAKCRADSTGHIRYGYKSTEEFNDSQINTELGIVKLAEDPGIFGAIFGSNDPQPHRARRKYTGAKTFSSYCSFDKVKTAKVKGWSISPPNYINMVDTLLAKAVCITLSPTDNVFKYAWRMSNTFYNKVSGDFTNLGIDLLTNADLKEAVAGANNFKPAVAVKQKTDGSILRTYADPEKSSNNGWNITPPVWYTV